MREGAKTEQINGKDFKNIQTQTKKKGIFFLLLGRGWFGLLGCFFFHLSDIKLHCLTQNLPSRDGWTKTFPLKKPPKTAQTTQPTYAEASFNQKRSNLRTVFPQGCVQAGIPYRSGQGMLLLLSPAKQTIPDLCCSQHHMKLHIYLEYNHTGVLVWVFFFFQEGNGNSFLQQQDGSDLG